MTKSNISLSLPAVRRVPRELCFRFMVFSCANSNTGGNLGNSFHHHFDRCGVVVHFSAGAFRGSFVWFWSIHVS